MLFPTHSVACRCQEFFNHHAPDLPPPTVRILDFAPAGDDEQPEEPSAISPRFSAILFPEDRFNIAKQFWQHSGDGVSSRRAEFCSHFFEKGLLIEASTANQSSRSCKGPRRYQKNKSIELDQAAGPTRSTIDVQDPVRFVEERFGRNLDLSLTRNAKLAIRRRIAGSLTADIALPEALSLYKDTDTMRQVDGFSEDDVFLYPTGMSSIFNAHRNVLRAKGSLKAIVFGYADKSQFDRLC